MAHAVVRDAAAWVLALVAVAVAVVNPYSNEQSTCKDCRNRIVRAAAAEVEHRNRVLGRYL